MLLLLLLRGPLPHPLLGCPQRQTPLPSLLQLSQSGGNTKYVDVLQAQPVRLLCVDML